MSSPIPANRFKDRGHRKAAPDFALRVAQGSELKLSEYRGKVVLVNYWATWCGPCRIEIPWFVEFEKAYLDRGFAVIGVSMDEDGWRSVKPYIGEQSINYPVVIGTEDVARRLEASIRCRQPCSLTGRERSPADTSGS